MTVESVRSPIVYSRDQLLALERLDVPRQLKSRRCGCCTRAARHSRGNVRSLPDKTDELTALTRDQRDYSECSIMVLAEMWLTALTQDTDVNVGGFQLQRADRMAESSERKGGGLAVIVNDRWCNSGHITVKEQVCSKDIKLLAVSMRPHYLPR